MAKILIADDDPYVLSLLCAYLEEAGYEVISARDGAEALDRAIREMPDAVVADCLMPRLHASALQVKLQLRLPHTPIPVISLEKQGMFLCDSAREPSRYDRPLLPFDSDALVSLLYRLLAA